jgi:hypothetical protein
MMKNTLIIAILVCFLMVPPLVTAYSSADPLEAPPVAQALVREGDFAVKLAEALNLGSPVSEVEAMSILAASGIAPGNGWIADYPVTPDIIGELEAAVGDAADEGRLAVTRYEALYAFQGVAAEFGLAVAADPEAGYEEKEPPESYPLYSDRTTINHYYYDTGPPVVTYYPPPMDHSYLYAWVPYPFYWHSFWFPGFFILHDFNRVVYVRQRAVKVVTNHKFVPRSRRVVIVDHRSRARGKNFEDGRKFSDRRRFDSPEARRGASSIVERSRNRGRSWDSSDAARNRGTSMGRAETLRPESRREGRAFTRSGPGAGASRDSRTESFSRPGTGLRLEGRRPGAFSNNREVRSFNRPDASSSGSVRSFDRPSGSRRGSGFEANIHSGGRSSGSFSGTNRSSIQRGPSGRTGTSFERPSRSGTGSRSLSSPSLRGGSGNGRGGSARGGSSGGGCRGRC